MIARFFHRLWHYHCEECIEEELQLRSCASCETLKQQLALANQENARLLELIVRQNEPIREEITSTLPIQVQSRSVPWRVKQQMLEQADRERAQALRRNQNESINELEKELGVDDAS